MCFKSMRYGIPAFVVVMLFAGGIVAHAQDDGRIIFVDPKSKDDKVMSEEDLKPRTSAGGVDVMLGDDGFGLGVFYHKMLNDEITAFATLSFSEVEDGRQRTYYSYWGEEIQVNKLNYIFRIPLFLGVQYRLFKDEIVDNFRPYVNAGAGPVMLYIAPARRGAESLDFFGSLPYGQPKYTYGGFLGAGAQFGFDKSSILGVNVRYYLIPAPSGVQAVDQGTLANANGFFITLNVGTVF